jgi:uncharacterized membrane protein
MNKGVYILIFLVSVFISSGSQILLKKSTKEVYSSVIKEYLNLRVIFAYTLFFGATLLTIFAYKGVDLSFGLVLESTGYIFVTFMSIVFLKERLTLRKITGIFLIIIGIIIFGLF